ncbi:MAG: response regulator [Gammaproteobacteria bacterium]|nr:response regulator [Gammaproteobacteria bacterium]
MEKIKNPELIQSIIRLCIGLLTYLYISAGIDSGYFSATHKTLNYFTAIFFCYSIINTLSILWIPSNTPRRYLALSIDIASTTFSSYLTGGINSVYVLIYLWIYIGYGTRYGLKFLSIAVILTLIGYNILLLTEDAWHLLTLEAIAFLLLIIALPAYLYSMQKRLMTIAEKADSNNIAKSEFLSTMTQQIRTPIGGIVGMIDLLNKTSLNVQQKQYLQSLSQSSHSLQDIIEDIVDFSSIEEGNIPITRSSSNPRTLIDSLVHSLAALGHERELELTCYIDQSFPDAVCIDAQRFRQLLSNLIRYVIEHSTSRGIYIHAYAGNPSLTEHLNANIEIKFHQNTDLDHLHSNNIPETNDALPLRIGYQLTRLMNGIFEIQYNEKNDICFNLHFNWQKLNSTKKDNTPFPENKRALIYDADKLNLDVLEKYCQQLGIEVYSTSGDDNLIAHIIWSREKQRPFDIIILGENRKHKNCYDLVSRIRNETKCNTPVLYASYMHSIEQIEAESLAGIQATVIKPVSLDILKTTLLELLNSNTTDAEDLTDKQTSLNILVAEDNEINASVVYSHLTDLGHNVDIATDGTTALYAMHKHHYHLVLMDISMPNMNGIEATRQWRRLEDQNTRLAIIALTAKATSEDRELCLKAGMDDFLSKPVNESQLKNVLSKHINSEK